MNDTEIWSGERLTAEMAAAGLKQNKLVKLVGPPPTGPSETVLSWWRNGVRPPSARYAQRVQGAIEGIRILRERGVDVSNVRKTRQLLRQMGDVSKAIPQTHGSAFIAEFCSHARLAPEEFAACAQLRTTIVNAAVVSLPAQKWIRAWAGAMAATLGDTLFDDYAATFAKRHAALEDLANKSFARLIAEVGREQILHYMQGLLLTAELRQAPRDLDEN